MLLKKKLEVDVQTQIKEIKKEIKTFEDEIHLENNMRKVKDHDHLRVKYRGAAHSICNINYKVPRFIPVFFHNVSGYDAHLFIKEFEKILRMKDDQEKGYIFEVDLKYREELHDLHSDYPLAPENVFDNKELPKLTTTLYDKKKYILHYNNLILYLSLGLKLEKIHRIIEFD
ncbi:Ribonuclease H-like domain [Cinara cedri]|uniref:Ribonuclease H-like domain n=1 Tax=Cinara cedri TaxID=506608 RepID=A0A5E4MKI9_9HEMI|nr:Ribonuclease H-like domain [Cinara cedri]